MARDTRWDVIAEGAGHFGPCRRKIVPVGAGHANGRLEHIRQAGAAFLQRKPEIVDRLAVLRGDITRCNDAALIIERACASGEDEAGRRAIAV